MTTRVCRVCCANVGVDDRVLNTFQATDLSLYQEIDLHTTLDTG